MLAKNEIEATKVLQEPSPGIPNRQEALEKKFLLTTARARGIHRNRRRADHDRQDDLKTAARFDFADVVKAGPDAGKSDTASTKIN